MQSHKVWNATQRTITAQRHVSAREGHPALTPHQHTHQTCASWPQVRVMCRCSCSCRSLLSSTSSVGFCSMSEVVVLQHTDIQLLSLSAHKPCWELLWPRLRINSPGQQQTAHPGTRPAAAAPHALTAPATEARTRQQLRHQTRATKREKQISGVPGCRRLKTDCELYLSALVRALSFRKSGRQQRPQRWPAVCGAVWRLTQTWEV